jgi:hypothetical protein
VICRRAPGAALLLGAVVVAAGCATPLSVAPDTPERDVRARFGKPTAVIEGVGGRVARRLEYAIGPYFQATYMVDVGGDDRVLAVSQVLTLEHFAQVKIDVDTRSTIRREFGTPYRINRYPRMKIEEWLYPYKNHGAFNDEMAIDFDPSGVVRRIESIPDPRFDTFRERGAH